MIEAPLATSSAHNCTESNRRAPLVDLGGMLGKAAQVKNNKNHKDLALHICTPAYGTTTIYAGQGCDTIVGEREYASQSI